MIPVISCPKPERRTPEQRKAEREARTAHVFKPAKADKPKRHGFTQRQPKAEEDQNCFKTYRKREPWKGLQPGQGLGASTGTRTLQKRLQRLLVKQKGYKIETISHRPGFTLKKGQPLKVVGRRGRRLAPEDKKQSAAVKGLQCLCACNTHERDPKAIQWMHLQRRNILETRHEKWATAPGCEHLHPWLDQGNGVQARKELFDLAKELGRRLTPEDAFPILSRWGYYTELARKEVQMR